MNCYSSIESVPPNTSPIACYLAPCIWPCSISAVRTRETRPVGPNHDFFTRTHIWWISCFELTPLLRPIFAQLVWIPQHFIVWKCLGGTSVGSRPWTWFTDAIYCHFDLVLPGKSTRLHRHCMLWKMPDLAQFRAYVNINYTHSMVLTR